MNPADRMGGHEMTDHYEKALDTLALDASTDAVAMTLALLAVADAIAAHNRPTPTIESPATGEPDTSPAPVGVGSVLDGNTADVAAALDTLPNGVVVLDRDRDAWQRAAAARPWWYRAGGTSHSAQVVADYAPLTVLWLPEAGESDE